jgi:hypothetical protein
VVKCRIFTLKREHTYINRQSLQHCRIKFAEIYMSIMGSLKATCGKRRKNYSYHSAAFLSASVVENHDNVLKYFTFVLPCCIVIDFLLNNQPYPLIIPILFCHKILHVSAIFSARHQEFSTVHSALLSFMQVSD